MRDLRWGYGCPSDCCLALKSGIPTGVPVRRLTWGRFYTDEKNTPNIFKEKKQLDPVRRITENHTFTENHRKSPKTTWKIIIIEELYPPSICFLVVYVYI